MTKKQVEITDVEYELLLNDSLIYEVFGEIIDAVVHDGENCHISVTGDELNKLARYVQDESENVPDRRQKKLFKTLSKYLNTL